MPQDVDGIGILKEGLTEHDASVKPYETKIDTHKDKGTKVPLPKRQVKKKVLCRPPYFVGIEA